MKRGNTGDSPHVATTKKEVKTVPKCSIHNKNIVEQHFSTFVPTVPLHIAHLLEVPLELAGNDFITRYFQVRRPNATSQTQVRG